MQADDRELAATQLLMSHLCHEMASSIGAINNGVEMIEEFGGNEMAADATALIAESGKAAAVKLRFYRLAYGSAGRASDLSLSQCAMAAGELLALDGKVSLAWPPAPASGLPAGGPQVLLNLVVLGATALPRGGRLGVLSEVREGRDVIHIVAAGTGAKLSDAVRHAVEGRDCILDHSNIHAWYCSRLATRVGIRMTVAGAPDEIRITAESSAAGQRDRS